MKHNSRRHSLPKRPGNAVEPSWLGGSGIHRQSHPLREAILCLEERSSVMKYLPGPLFMGNFNINTLYYTDVKRAPSNKV